MVSRFCSMMLLKPTGLTLAVAVTSLLLLTIMTSPVTCSPEDTPVRASKVNMNSVMGGGMGGGMMYPPYYPPYYPSYPRMWYPPWFYQPPPYMPYNAAGGSSTGV